MIITVNAPQQADSPSLLEKGTLADVPFARLFSCLARERVSGFLFVRDKPAEEGGKPLRRVTVVDGEKFAVQGGSKKETLPEILLEQKKIKPEQYQALVQKAGGDYGKMEELVKGGQVIPPADVPDLLSFQLELKLKMLFAFTAGHYEFKPQDREALLARNVLLPVSAAKLLGEGVKEFYPLVRIKKEFPGIEKKVMSRPRNFKDLILPFGLPPNILRWLRGLPETFSWQSVEKTAPLKEEELWQLLLTFYFAGLITLPPDQEADFPVGRAYLEEPKPQKKRIAEEVKTAAKPTAGEPQPTVKAAEAKLPIEELLDKEMSDEEHLALIDHFLKIAADKESSYFDLLGVSEQVPISKIKTVYFKFARRFHPDARPDLFLGEIKEKVEELFNHLTTAYNTLSENETRAEYIKARQSKISDADKENVQRAYEAEVEFMKASVFIKRGAWRDALGLLERAALLQPEEPEFQLHLAWARYKTNNATESRTRDQIKILAKQLANRPEALADANFYLGLLAKSDGLAGEAINYFEEALKLKPEDIQIKRELQILYRRKDQAPPDKKGGLFGKKK